MDLRTYLAIIRKYLPLLVIGALVGLLGGYALYASKPKQYAADVTFYVSTPVADNTSAQSAGQFATSRMVSYVQLLQSQQLGERVAKASGVSLNGAQVANRITANTTVETVLVTVTVTDSDGQQALKLAQGINKVFGPMVDELDNISRKTPVVAVKTVSEPHLHSAPVAPKSKTLLLGGLGLGLGLALAFAIFRELLSNSVKSEAELRERAGAPVIGAIAADRRIATSPLLRSEEPSARAESHRKLRTNLAFLDATGHSRVLAFTAPAAGDGATTVAANTALTFAETGERVLLIDADLREGGASQLFGLDGPGLSGVLAGTALLEQAVRSTANGGIDVLPAGELPPNPAALLGQPAFVALLEAVRERYDRVVLDTPALLPVADAATVGALSDGMVVVTRDGRTTADQMERTRGALEAVHCRLLGVVRNRVKAEGGARSARK